MNCRTSGPPVLSIRMAFIVEGIDDDIVLLAVAAAVNGGEDDTGGKWD